MFQGLVILGMATIAMWPIVGLASESGKDPEVMWTASSRTGLVGRTRDRPSGRGARPVLEPTRRRSTAKGGDLMRTREANRKKLADTEKTDAGG